MMGKKKEMHVRVTAVFIQKARDLDVGRIWVGSGKSRPPKKKMCFTRVERRRRKGRRPFFLLCHLKACCNAPLHATSALVVFCASYIHANPY